MPAPENTGSAAPVDNSPSLVSFAGEMYGDFSDAEPETDEGTPPASSPESVESSEGTPESAPAATPAEADPAAVPDNATPEDSADVDPFADAKPFDYAVDGETRLYDGIKVLKDGSAIIENPAHVQEMRRVYGERDHLKAKDDENFRRYSDLEKLTQWQVRDAAGKIETLTGPHALETLRVEHAQHVAENQLLRAVFSSDEEFAKLVDFRQDNEGNWYVVRKADALEMLSQRVDLSKERYANGVRSYLGKLAVPTPPPAPPETPVSEHALPTIDALEKQHAITGLTADDKKFLAGQFARYVEGTGNARVVNPLFLDVIKDRAALRAQQGKIATVATTAEPRNAARLAQASIGKNGKNGKQPPKITQQPEPERTRSDDFDEAWDRAQKAAAGALRAHATTR